VNAWTQPICRACYAAYALGKGKHHAYVPVQILGALDTCCLCGGDATVYIRVDPKLTEGLKYAREK